MPPLPGCVSLEGFAESCQITESWIIRNRAPRPTRARRPCPSTSSCRSGFTEAVMPRFFHQPVITAFVRTLLGDWRTATSPVDSTGTYDEAALAREAGSGQG